MRQRVLQGAPAALRVVLNDQDGSPVASSGTLTAAVAAADGTVVLPAGTATVADSNTVGLYTVQLPASGTAALTVLTVTWTDSARVVTSEHEVVGGYFFSLAEARASNGGDLSDEGKYPDAVVLAGRQAVEDEAERICDVAFVPRYQRLILGGGGTSELVLAHHRIRVVRSVRTYSIPGGTQDVAFTATQLSGLVLEEDGTIRRSDFGVFDDGTGNLIVEYEHGWSSPPQLVKDAALIRLRSVLTRSSTGIGERATSYTAENGQTFQLATASTYRTGIAEVDAAYGKYSYRELASEAGEAVLPVSRQLNFDPQRYSTWHGGVR